MKGMLFWMCAIGMEAVCGGLFCKLWALYLSCLYFYCKALYSRRRVQDKGLLWALEETCLSFRQNVFFNIP